MTSPAPLTPTVVDSRLQIDAADAPPSADRRHASSIPRPSRHHRDSSPTRPLLYHDTATDSLAPSALCCAAVRTLSTATRTRLIREAHKKGRNFVLIKEIFKASTSFTRVTIAADLIEH